MIVLDASAAVELVLATRPGAAVARRSRGETVHAPAHLDVEVLGAIRRAVARQLISEHEGLVAVADFLSLPGKVRGDDNRVLAIRSRELDSV